MSPDNEISSKAELRASRRTLLIIMAIVVIPFLLAYTMWRTGVWMPISTTNKGSLLLPPLHVDELRLKERDGAAIDYQSAAGRWAMIIIGDGVCDATCENALYLTRQVHIALGKEASRVLRYYGELGVELDEQLAATLAEEHPRLVAVNVDREEFSRYVDTRAAEQGLDFDSQVLVQESYILIADPLGNIMLYFTSGHSGKDILKDLKKLLKNSKLG